MRAFKCIEIFPFAQWLISNFPRSLTRNIASHSVKNLAFHSLSQMNDDWLYCYPFWLPHFLIGRMSLLNLGVKRLITLKILLLQTWCRKQTFCPKWPMTKLQLRIAVEHQDEQLGSNCSECSSNAMTVVIATKKVCWADRKDRKKFPIFVLR